ncbi:hypothetical protein [Rothia koreensis]|uniref:hypothetical protein n=1 Tax=Rothia koreensis TaxID=592378 RepID=UPI003FCC35C8
MVEPNESNRRTEPPTRPQLADDDPRTSLQNGIRAALLALPGEFRFKHNVSGVAATDLFNLNTFLGAGIELEVVRTLNALRPIWDPDNEWSTYKFERSNQAFPDVRLVDRSSTTQENIALGIELKGWWMLAKEGVPSLRYQVSPDACTDFDLVCVVPWHLSSAVSGEAMVVAPWVESARYAAEWRDYWWQHLRTSSHDTSIDYPEDAAPYPTKADRVTAIPAYDGGKNYGRLPRSRPLMDTFIQDTMSVPILGIAADSWVKFLQLHKDNVDPDFIANELQRRLDIKNQELAPDIAARILSALDDIENLLL